MGVVIFRYYMRILMLGWEFPPVMWGGLAVVCEGLTKGLFQGGDEVYFAIPNYPSDRGPYCRFIPVFGRGREVMHGSWWKSSASTYSRPAEGVSFQGPFLRPGTLQEAVFQFAELLGKRALEYPHDVIHAHDWLTYPAGFAIHAVSGKPVVVHVHTIEADRTGGNGVNQHVRNIEHDAFQRAAAVIAVSEFTKKRIVHEYGIDPNCITVVHNGFDWGRYDFSSHDRFFPNQRVVLFLGRLTLQRGPDYFLSAAEIVARHCEDAVFVIAGEGDMHDALVRRAAQSQFHDRIVFATAWGRDADRLFERADLFVMPSVSDPFGMVLLEAVAHHTPVICSKTCGASEVVPWAIRVDFWDREELANNMIALLRYPALRNEEMRLTYASLPRDQWKGAAEKCRWVYEKVIQNVKLKTQND